MRNIIYSSKNFSEPQVQLTRRNPQTHYNEGAKTKIESLETTWKKWTIILSGTPIRLIADFSSEVIEMAVGWHIQSAQRKKKLYRILHPIKVIFKNED